MVRVLIILILLTGSLISNAQIITTIAGTGSTAYTGDGGSATAANIGYPQSCAFDVEGNFYFEDINHCVVRKITPCGVISTVAGTGSCGYNGDGILATSAKINTPSGITLDALGNMYIAEQLNNRVRKVDAATGLISTLAGNGTTGFSGDGGPATAAVLYNPANICLDNYGNIYFGDGNERIRKINTSGIISTFAGTGTPGYTGDSGPATAAEIENIAGLCSDTAGDIFFGQQVDNRVRKIDTNGIITTIAGDGSYIPAGDGGPATAAGLDIWGLTFDQNENLYVSGYIENDVRMINTSGIISTVAGNTITGFSGDGGPAYSAELHYAEGIAIDLYGNLYIADELNSRIRKVTFNSVIIPTITVTANPGDTVCSGTPVTFTATVSGSSTPITYQWLVNGSATGTGSIYAYTPASGDSIRCVLSVVGLCAMPSSNTINMVVNTITVPAITITAPAAATVGSVVTVNAVVAGAGSSYSINWYDNGGLFNTTTVPVVTYTKGVGADDITATVVPVGLMCYDSTTSGVWEVSDSDEEAPSISPQGGVTVYPNPINGLLHVDNVSTQTDYRILSIVGTQILQGTLQQGNNTISMQSLSSGIYVLEVTGTDGVKTIIKIVKQ